MATYRTYLFAMLKGGTRKTTSAVFTAFELTRQGERVLVVDADRSTQGVTDWATRMDKAGDELPFWVEQAIPGKLLAVQVRNAVAELARDGVNISYVILDVGGEQPATVREAAIIADMVLIPVGVEQAELSRLASTIDLVGQGVDGDLSRYACLLTRVPSIGKGLAKVTRELIEGSGHQVMLTEIPQNRELYANVWGTRPDSTGAYLDLAGELRARHDDLLVPSPAGAL